MSKISLKDYLHFFGVFLLCFISVYLMPSIINKIFFIALLIAAYRSKKDYFWFALFFVLISTPGALFFGGSADETHRIPIYTIVKGISISLFDFFISMMLLKSLINAKSNPLFLNKIFTILGIFYIFIFLYSLLLGMSPDNIIRVLRNTLYFSLLISLSRLMPKPEDVYRFCHLVFPFAILVLIGAFSQMIYGVRLIDTWAGAETNTNFAVALGSSELFQRPNLYGTIISFFSLIFGLYYFSRNDYNGKKLYLLLIVLISYISFIVSQSRGWITSTSLILLLFLLLVQKAKSKSFSLILISISLFFILVSVIEPLSIAVNNSFTRYSTMVNLIEGDITAAGTNIRFSERLPKVLNGITQNPIFGFGFSDIYLSFADYHVGFATMLLQIGIIGYLLFIWLWLKFYGLVYSFNKKLYSGNPLKSSLLLFSIAFSGILLMHFTSYQFMGFEFMLPSDYYFICIFFVFSDNQLKESLQISNLTQRYTV